MKGKSALFLTPKRDNSVAAFTQLLFLLYSLIHPWW